MQPVWPILFLLAALTLQSRCESPSQSGASKPLAFARVRGSGAGGAVLDTGVAGSFDAEWVTRPSVLRAAGAYRMWHSSFASSSPKERSGGIGLAESPDGIEWTRFASEGKPIFALGPAGAFDHGQVMGPCVLHDGAIYRMWYTGDSGQMHSSGFVRYQIGLAISRDGVLWTRANGGAPVLANGPAGAPDEVQAATPAVIAGPSGYRMWYAAWAPELNHTVCVAKSEDGIHWTKENDGRPVTFVAVDGDRLRVWYTGYQIRGKDLTQWRLRIGLTEADISGVESRDVDSW